MYQAITATIELKTALHVGTGRDGKGTDSPIRRRPNGQPVIPGTAIAGVLRTDATRLAPRLFADAGVCRALRYSQPQRNEPCGCLVCRLFGDVSPGRGGDEQSGGRASRIWVYDALFDLETATWIRDNVGINRANRSAARLQHVKFDAEVIPAGATCELRLELDADTDAEAMQLLAAVLGEWQAGRGGLGGRRSRGNGSIVLREDVVFLRNGMDSAENILAFLQTDTPTEAAKADETWLATQLAQLANTPRSPNTTGTRGIADTWLDIAFTLTTDGLFLSNDVVVSGLSGFDHAPLLDGLPNSQQTGRPLLAGSTIRGALRSQAERIARTITTHAAGDRAEFLERCPACYPIEADLNKPLTRCDALLADDATVKRADRVQEHNLCLACWLFGSPRNGSRFLVEDAPYSAATAPVWKPLDFLAVNRFTGGALETAKFDAIALWRPEFAVRLRLENPAAWEIGWLAFVLRDLVDGLIPVGYGAAKGLARVSARGFDVTLGYLTDDVLPADLPAAAESQTSGMYHTVSTTGLDLLETQRAAFRTKIDDYRRDYEGLPVPNYDAYFGRNDLDILYPIISEGGA